MTAVRSKLRVRENCLSPKFEIEITVEKNYNGSVHTLGKGGGSRGRTFLGTQASQHMLPFEMRDELRDNSEESTNKDLKSLSE